MVQRELHGDTKSVTIIQNLDFRYPSNKKNKRKLNVNKDTTEFYDLIRNCVNN